MQVRIVERTQRTIVEESQATGVYKEMARDTKRYAMFRWAILISPTQLCQCRLQASDGLDNSGACLKLSQLAYCVISSLYCQSLVSRLSSLTMCRWVWLVRFGCISESKLWPTNFQPRAEDIHPNSPTRMIQHPLQYGIFVFRG